MNNCKYCGNPLREGSLFCASCGKPVEEEKNAVDRESESYPTAPAVTTPLITLSPAQGSYSAKRLIAATKTVLAIVLVVALALGGVAIWAYLNTDPFAKSTINTVDDDTYKQCLALVRDVRNENFREYVDDYVNQTGVAEGINFYTEYETKFREIIPDDSAEEAVMFRDCCYMVSFAEFEAKRLENLANGGFLYSIIYRREADTYRAHADKLYEMLNSAKTSQDLQAIIDYCSENDIIELK